jgi:hypothetical protein
MAYQTALFLSMDLVKDIFLLTPRDKSNCIAKVHVFLKQILIFINIIKGVGVWKV